MRILNYRLSLQDFSDLTFIFWLASVVKFEFISTSTHAKYFEAIDFGYKSRCRHHLVIIMFEEYVGETGTKVRAVNIKLLLAGQVYVHAARAVNFYS